jgi:hypothetical protein
VALLQPEEARDEPDDLTGPERKKKKKREVIDLTNSEKIKRKKEMKSASNGKQSEKRRVEKERERERLKSLSPGEKRKLAEGVNRASEGWKILNLYDKEQSNLTWSSGKRKEELQIGVEEDDSDWERKRVEEIEREIDRD